MYEMMIDRAVEYVYYVTKTTPLTSVRQIYSDGRLFYCLKFAIYLTYMVFLR